MILETITIIGVAVGMGVKVYLDIAETIKKKNSTAPGITYHSNNDIVNLVAELLREGQGWDTITGQSYRHNHSGVVIFEHIGNLYYTVSLSVQNDKGAFCDVELTQVDRNLLKTELVAYKSRERDSQQKKLARVLAERIVSPEGAPVLGGREPVLSSDDDSVERNDPVPAGMLTYDKAKQQVVVHGESSSGLQLGDELRKRYNMLSVPTKQESWGEILNLAYDPSSDVYVTHNPTYKGGGTYLGKRIVFEDTF